MSTINRRTFIKGTTASSLFVLTLAGCSEKKSAPIKSAQAQGVTQGSAKPHYVMVFDQNKCVGCGECKEACAETNKTPAGVFRLALERQNGREPERLARTAEKSSPATANANMFVFLVSSVSMRPVFASARHRQLTAIRKPTS